MLEKNDIQCWLTTAERTDLAEIKTSSGELDVVTCTVKLQGRKSYIINWSSKIPITAWCEIHTKSPNGKTTKGISKCEMDATNPVTQQRTSQDGISTGRNLGFYGRRLSSASLGMAWLEIRRATSIRVNEVTKGERQLTIDWLPSDRPDVGTPYVTFVFNFELAEPFAHTSHSPASPRHIQPSPPGRSLRPTDKFNSAEKERDDKYSLRSLAQTPAKPSPAPDLTPIFFQMALHPILKRGGPSTTPKTADPSNAPEPSLPPIASKPAPPSTAADEPLPPTTFNEILPSSLNPGSKPEPSADPPKAKAAPSKVKITIKPTNAEASNATPENGLHKKRKAEVDSQSEPARVSKQPRINASAGPSKTTRSQDDSVAPASAKQHNPKKDRMDYAAKNAKLETEIKEHIAKLSKARGKERYMELKQERLELLAQLRAAERALGPLSPNKSFFQEWNPAYDSDKDDDYASKRRKIESDIPALRIQLAALKEKKDYREKKSRLKQLKDEIQATALRCKKMEEYISRMNDPVGLHENEDEDCMHHLVIGPES